MAVFAPEECGPFRIVQSGGRHHAVFSTFTIPAASREEAERRGRLAVARGARNQREMDAAGRQYLVDFSKATEAARKLAEDDLKARAEAAKARAEMMI